MRKNAMYAQSGGVTTAINSSAAGVIKQARAHPDHIDDVLAANNGILGIIQEELFTTKDEGNQIIANLIHTPGGSFGSCRVKLPKIEDNPEIFKRIFEVFSSHNIGYFFYNGGGDSADTCLKINSYAQKINYPIQCIHIPKTVDNDLPLTDNCPGFGSVAKYIAISTREAAMDLASMSKTSTKVFILEVMGRHTGWIAAASGLASSDGFDAPHIILFPEVVFDEAKFLNKVQSTVQEKGYCVIVVSEGLKNSKGDFLSDSGLTDAFGHKQLGGVASTLAQIIRNKLKIKYHYAIVDYLQRSARHIASATDIQQALAVGVEAVEYALSGKTGVMPAIERIPGNYYQWRIKPVNLSDVANIEKSLPPEYIREDGYHITEAARNYLFPLIEGESYPPYNRGLPLYSQPKWQLVEQKLPAVKLEDIL